MHSTNTPTLASGSGTTGHFYIVSVAGSTNLDGVTDWEVGDWAVFIEQGASDQWEKIDNSSVLGGSGTGQKIAKWDGSGTSVTLTNSVIAESSGNSWNWNCNFPTSPTSVTTFLEIEGTTAGIVLHDDGNDAWDLFASGGKLGTRYNNSVEGWWLDHNGLMGVGTTAPGAKLEVLAECGKRGFNK